MLGQIAVEYIEGLGSSFPFSNHSNPGVVVECLCNSGSVFRFIVARRVRCFCSCVSKQFYKKSFPIRDMPGEFWDCAVVLCVTDTSKDLVCAFDIAMEFCLGLSTAILEGNRLGEEFRSVWVLISHMRKPGSEFRAFRSQARFWGFGSFLACRGHW